ncbi:acyltransferase family protein [Kitasatospora sp. NPDC048540]|uniref:acyltransferase family protein n=1 Tax=unclassified Kitasatospora TaxID=2633591 RepID=UPI0009E8E2ED|nr:acyltransferase family protein [Kitasatospora sp. MBT63]
MTAPAHPGYLPPGAVRPPAAVPATGPVTATPAARAKPGRDRYLDFLRALALVRVVFLHMFAWTWLPIVFPSMGVMFALAGSLMARSLSRPTWSVIRGRLRRLLPPLWLLGLIAVPGMLLQGWSAHGSGHSVAGFWGRLALWVLPLMDPPYGDPLPGVHGLLDHAWGEHAAGPLWYLRAYLWFVLLSPLMLALLRRIPWLVLPAPMLFCVVMQLGYVDFRPEIYSVVDGFATYGSCWMLGMAYQEGLLSRFPRYVLPSIVPFVMAVSLWWTLNGTNDEGGPQNLEDSSLGQAVWSFGFVLLLLAASPSWDEWPPRLKRWAGWISLLNSRAVTVYLWHNLAITAAISLFGLTWYVPVLAENVPWLLDSDWVPMLLAWPLIGLCIVAFGWIEDVAAKRSPRLFPYPRAPRSARRR